jgi:hypothetical protein
MIAASPGCCLKLVSEILIIVVGCIPEKGWHARDVVLPLSVKKLFTWNNISLKKKFVTL